jgi:hypothetical protein
LRHFNNIDDLQDAENGKKCLSNVNITLQGEFQNPTILIVCRELLVTFRGVPHKCRILGGIKNKSKADGRTERIVSSKRSVKSNVTLPGNSINGPKLLSSREPLELIARLRFGRSKCVSILGKSRSGETHLLSHSYAIKWALIVKVHMAAYFPKRPEDGFE